jgi:hypothetical protein
MELHNPTKFQIPIRPVTTVKTYYSSPEKNLIKLTLQQEISPVKPQNNKQKKLQPTTHFRLSTSAPTKKNYFVLLYTKATYFYQPQ